MITTTAQDEILRHPFLLSPQSKLWRRVILEQSTPVFLVQYETRDGPAWLGRSPATKMHVVEYVTTDGLRYLEGPGRIEEGGLTQLFSMAATDA